MESGCFFQPVLHRVSNAAAGGTPGVDFPDTGIIQLPQSGEESGGKGVHIRLGAIGQGITAIVQWQLLLKAQYPVSGFKMASDIGGGFFPAGGATGGNEYE